VLLEAMLQELPPAAPRVVAGVGKPADVIAAVGAGVDAFSNAYPMELTRQGFAATFDIPLLPEGDAQPLQPPCELPGVPALGVASGTERDGLSQEPARAPTKIQLRDRRYDRDQRPLLPGCTCPTCERYTRAYIAHLLNANEMLADGLLYAHNLHHYLRFFAEMRRHIAAGRFAHFASQFS